MPILDAWGRPVRRADLQREVAGPTTTGVRSILTAHPAGPWTPARLAAILRESEQPGHGASEEFFELAEVMEERDPHYLGVLATRKRQVAQLGVQIEPASDSADDVRDADLVRGFFRREAVEDELIDLLDALGKGVSVSEIDWEASERQWMPRRLLHRLPQWFDWDPESGSELRYRSDAGAGWAPLPAWKFVRHQALVKSGLPVRGGLARCVAWTWLFRSYAVKDWMRFAEAYGQPLRLGKFSQSATPEDKATLERAVRNISVDAAAIIPEGMNIEWVADTTVRGRSEIYRELIAYLDSRVSIAVLGQTLTTEQGDRGSQALGRVHNLVREDIERSDALQLAQTLRRDLVVPIVQLNHGPRAAYPRVLIERSTAADLGPLVDALEKLVPLGLRVRADDVLGRLGLERPGRADDVLAPPAAPAARPASALPALGAAQPAIDGGLDAVVEGWDGETWRALAAPLVEPILQRAAGDPEVLSAAGLASVWPDVDVDALTERLARLLFVADALGRSGR